MSLSLQWVIVGQHERRGGDSLNGVYGGRRTPLQEPLPCEFSDNRCQPADKCFLICHGGFGRVRHCEWGKLEIGPARWSLRHERVGCHRAEETGIVVERGEHW